MRRPTEFGGPFLQRAEPAQATRRRRRFLGLALLAVVVFGVCALQAETVRIATYNVRNYGLADRMTEEGFRKEYPKPEREKTALRQVIRALNADILVLQEVGTRPYLEELRRDLRAEGCDYPHATLAEAADAERHLAVLSRRSLAAVETISDLEFPYFDAQERVKRGLLRIAFNAAGRELTIFGVHLKSRYTDRADDPNSERRRIAEATAVRNTILKLLPDPTKAAFLILGDCNDTKASKALARLQSRGETQISALVPAVDSRGETWTYFYGREETYSRVDFILVSPALRPAVRGGAAAVYDGPGVREASDHRPVVVTLDVER